MSKILVVIDMQNDFITGALGTKEAESIVGGVLKKIEDFEGEVVYTRDTHSKDYLKSHEGKHLPIPHCIIGTEGWQLEKRIRTIKDERQSPVFDKPSFGSTRLLDFILDKAKDKELTEIEFVGVCTDICVITNILTIKTFLPEMKLTAHSKLMAGTTPENHKKALDILRLCHIDVI